MMHARLLLVGISVAAGSLRGAAAATTTLPQGTSVSTPAIPQTTATLPMEDLLGLPVLENATNLASAAGPPRPTSCDPTWATQGKEPGKWCNKQRFAFSENEWDKCSCGIGWANIPGPKCLNKWGGLRAKPTPYWGTGPRGCYCWCGVESYTA